MYRFKNLSDDQLSVLRLNALIENTNFHNRRLAAAEEAAGLRAIEESKNEKILASLLVQNERDRVAAERAARESQAAGLEADLRARYFRLNGEALESDFQRDLPMLKQNHFVQRMDAEGSLESREAAKYAGYRM